MFMFMSVIASTSRRIRLTFRRRQAERDLHDEIAFHLARETEQGVSVGMPLTAAQRAARIKLGGVDSVLDACRETDRIEWIDAAVKDVSFAVRSFRRRPAFALGVLSVLAIGLGAGTAVFALVNRILLSPLPYREPSSLVRLFGTWENGTREGISSPDFSDVRRTNTSFESIAGAANSTPLVSLNGAGEPEQIVTRAITSGLFATLGITPVMGREFKRDEETFKGPRVVILGYALWQNQFAGARDVVGRSISINGVASTVVGVLPPFFNFVGAGELFTPVQPNPVPEMRAVRNLVVVARLKPGVRIDQARRELDALAARAAAENPRFDRGWSARLVSLSDDVVGDVRAGLIMLVGAVALLILLMSANVASLVLTQSMARSGEIAVRLSLGASRGRIVRQLLTENVVLCLVGGVAGCTLGVGGVALVKRMGPATIPRLADVSVDWRVLFAALLVAGTMGVIVGLEPAWRAFRRDVAEAMRGARTSTTKSRMRDNLVLVEVAVSVVLLIGAGLLVRSLANLTRVDPGFDARGVLTARMSVPPGKYSDATGGKLALFWGGLLQRIDELPGVSESAVTSELPLSGLNNPTPRQATPRGGKPFLTFLRSVSPGYVSAMRIPLRAGRFFNDADRMREQRVVVINDQFARDVFGTQNPVGQAITFDFRDRADTMDYQAVVVGVVGSVRHVNLANPPFREAFLPYSQSSLGAYSLVIRTREPLSMVQPLRALVASIDPGQSIGQMRALTEVVGSGLAQPKFRGYVLAGFACFALLLAAGGLYGLLTVMIAQRAKEIGIRATLGATDRDVVALLLEAALRPTIAGIVLGLAAGALLARSLSMLVYGVGVWDAASFMFAPLALIAAALAASYVPARRAIGIDPVTALRSD
jgi:predicted permease